MSTSPSNTSYHQKGGWIWWILFPPYAIYRFMRYSRLKWFVKVPVFLIITLAIVMAVDLAVSPHRVEIAVAEKAIDSYLKGEIEGESMLLSERLGEGVSVTPETKQLTVYYRVVTENSVYHMGLVSDDGNRLLVQQVEQLFPIRQNVKGFENRSKADIAIWLKEHEESVGVPQKMKKDDSPNNTQTILTSMGEYEFLYTNSHLYQVKDNKTNKVLMKVEETPPLPKEITEYLEKNKERVGSLTRVLAYELVEGVERYYLVTSEGTFMTESHSDGKIVINKRNE